MKRMFSPRRENRDRDSQQFSFPTNPFRRAGPTTQKSPTASNQDAAPTVLTPSTRLWTPAQNQMAESGDIKPARRPQSEGKSKYAVGGVHDLDQQERREELAPPTHGAPVPFPSEEQSPLKTILAAADGEQTSSSVQLQFTPTESVPDGGEDHLPSSASAPSVRSLSRAHFYLTELLVPAQNTAQMNIAWWCDGGWINNLLDKQSPRSRWNRHRRKLFWMRLDRRSLLLVRPRRRRRRKELFPSPRRGPSPRRRVPSRREHACGTPVSFPKNFNFYPKKQDLLVLPTILWIWTR